MKTLLRLVFCGLSALFLISCFTSCNQTSKKPDRNENNLETLQQNNHEVKLSAGEQKDLDEFFNKIVVCGLPHFTKDGLSNEDMISFAVICLYNFDINKFEKVDNSKDGISKKIKRNFVNEICKEFFGKDLKEPKTSESILYKEGCFWIGDSDAPEVSAKLEKLTENGDGTYLANIGIYSPDDANINKPSGTAKATLKKTDDHYILIDYQQ
jgi:hypothetical protein